MRLIFLCILALFAQPLHAADWLRAESANFVFHAKLSEEELREVVQRAEDFNRLLQGQLPYQVRPGRKLHIYLEGDTGRISRVSNFENTGFAVTLPEFSGGFGLYDPDDEDVFKHYSLFYIQSIAYMDSAFFRPSPLWVHNGVPAFFSTVYVNEEGDFILGAPDVRRPMKGSPSVSRLHRLLTTKAAPKDRIVWRRFYNLSREVVTPLLIDPQYGGVLENYLNAYEAGTPMDEAGTLLGDVEVLAEQIKQRLNTNKPTFRRVTLEPMLPVEIRVRPMDKDEIALIEPRFFRLRAKNLERAAERLRKLTERFPESEAVWFEYAAAEFARVQAARFGEERVLRGFGFSNGELLVLGNRYPDAEAWRAVNKSLELNPAYAQSLRLKSEIQLSRLIKEDTPDADAYEEVRSMLATLANNAEENPLAAALVFQSYIEQGLDAPDEALELLGRAFVANAGVEEFRYAYAVALVRRGHEDVAKNLLRSMLNDPRFREAAERALGEAGS